MHKTLLLIATGIFLSLGCGKEAGLRGKGDYGQLKDQDIQLLQEINSAQEENIGARKMAYGALISPSSTVEQPDQKVEKMAELITAECRTPAGSIPEEEMSGTPNEQIIQGASCPIYWNRYRYFNRAEKVFVMYDNFEARSPQYQELSPVLTRRVSGNYRVLTEGTTRVVRGKLEFTDYTHKALGKIKASVLTEQSYPTMDRGGGSVTLFLSIGSWKHSASITWDLKQFQPRYFVDSTEIERKAFEELFSSFELIKIMDNSLKMR